MNNTYHLIHIMLGASIVLLVISATFVSLQQPASAGRISKPEPPGSPPSANPAGSNTTGGIPSANPAGSNMTGTEKTTLVSPAGDISEDREKCVFRSSSHPAGSNMTGPAANTTGGIPSANPAGHQLGKDNPIHVPTS